MTDAEQVALTAALLAVVIGLWPGGRRLVWESIRHPLARETTPPPAAPEDPPASRLYKSGFFVAPKVRLIPINGDASTIEPNELIVDAFWAPHSYR